MTKASSAAPVEPGALLLFESAFALGAARLAVRAVPFRMLSRVLGRETDSPDAPAAAAAHRVSRAIESASRHVPWRSLCLEQALAAKAMLRLRGISNTLYMAVAREAALEAHAWLRSGDLCVTGQAEFDRYTIVRRFADKGRR